MSATFSPSLIQWLESERHAGAFTPAVAVVVAHPDDEVIGVGAQLARLRNLALVHVTDGAPADLRDATRAGFASAQEYAAARREELESALALAGNDVARTVTLGAVDQQASLDLPGLSAKVLELFRDFQPEIVLTHPYEGGHPDHDATAFAVHAACQQLRAQQLLAPELVEMTFYHNRGGGIAVGEFLPDSGTTGSRFALTESERHLKRRLLDCFRTQQETLRSFHLECEAFRPAPRYDFSQPPHPGMLFYEMFDWGMTGPRWRALAQEALRQFQFTGPI